MAILDWPADWAFIPSDFSIGADVPLAQWRAPNTGVREVYSRAADRMTCQVSLPPCKRDDAAKIESFLAGLLSAGDTVRMPAWHRRVPRGTLGGSPTVNGAVAAGVRSIVLAGALARPNLFSGGGFEIDSNADGLADGWTLYTSGSVGTVSTVMPSAAANTGTAGLCQRVSSTALNGSVGVRRTADVAVTVGLQYTFSISQAATSGTTISLEIAWYNGASYLSSSTASAVALNGRRSVTGTAPASATVCKLYVYMTSASSGAAALNVDEAQFEQASAVTAYAGLATVGPGDFIGTGSNLLQAAYSGATATDAGAITMPLAYPVQKAIANGAAVVWDTPTGVWQLEAAGISFDYSPGVIMDGLVLPFRQVVV